MNHIEKKKIIHISKVTGIHGMEKHLLSLLPRIASENCEIIFLILVEPHNPVTEYLRLLDKNGVIFHTITIRRDIDVLCFWKVLRFLRGVQPSLVHTHLIHGDIYGITAAKLAGVAHIISTKHNDDDFRREGLIKILNHFLSKKVTRIITISDWVRQFAESVEMISPEKMTTIYYGLEMPQTFRAREAIRFEMGCSNHDIVMGIVARLVEQKGHRYLIDAFAKAVHSNHNLKLVIVGSGNLEAALRKQVREAQLDKRVIFTGYRSDVYEILNAIDIFVHPSLWEGFGLSLLEAMAMGKPVIATRVSAIPEIVEDLGSGFLVLPKDTDALSSVILKLAEDRSLQQQMGDRGRERWKNLFSVERMVQATSSLYAEVLSL